MMKTLLSVLILLALASPASDAKEPPLRQANMSKLLTGKTRLVEVKRLMGLEKHNEDVRKMTQAVWEERMTDIRLIQCAQKSEKPLYLLMTKRGDDWYGYDSDPNSTLGDAYPKDATDRLFALHEKEKKGDPNDLDEPSSKRMEGYALTFFDSTGLEHRPFGGNNYISSGYLFDFNGDGVLERLEHTNWGVIEGYSVKNLFLKTVEIQPRTLLNVLYEWHPDSASNRNAWTYDAKDVDADGSMDVVLGPQNKESESLEQVEISYLWDSKKKAYIGPDGTKGDHYRRIYDNHFDEIKKSGGLGYPLLENEKDKIQAPTTRAEVMARKLHLLPDFTTMAMEEMLHFFSQGESEKDKDEKGFSTVFPEGMNQLSPKAAALTYADSNRTETHKENYRLAVDDRHHVSPPKKGWLVFTQHSASCYTFVQWLWAINLEKNTLVYCANSTNGVVGANRFLDEVGYDIRVIKLKKGEAEYLAGVLWWLDRIRSKKPSGSHCDQFGGISCSADGRCSMYAFNDGLSTHHYRGQTRWFGFNLGPSSRWDEDYTKTICGNLSAEFCSNYIPHYLGERWSRYAELEHRNLMTSHQEKMSARHSKGRLMVFRQSLKKIFQMHSESKVPSEVLGWMARAAGDLGMAEFTADLTAINATLKPISPEEVELEALNKELKTTLKKLAVANSPKKLTAMSLESTYESYWAQKQLRRRFPDEYGDVLLERLRRAMDNRGKEQAIEMLVEAAPKKALLLVQEMPEADKQFFALSLLTLYQKELADQMDEMYQWIMAKAKDKKSTWEHRHAAVRLLVPEVFPSHEKEIYPLLLSIASEKKVKSDGDYSPHPHSACIASLVQWPRAQKDWERIKKVSALRTGETWDQEGVMRSLVRLSIHCGPEARKEVKAILEDRLLNGTGDVERQIKFIFYHGYRKCLPLIEHMATSSPEDEQSRWALSSQGPNKKPTATYSYHVARQLRALWTKHDAQVDSRIWAAMALQNPALFIDTNDDTPKQGELSSLGKNLILILKPTESVRNDFLNRAKTHPTYYDDHLALLCKEIAKLK